MTQERPPIPRTRVSTSVQAQKPSRRESAKAECEKQGCNGFLYLSRLSRTSLPVACKRCGRVFPCSRGKGPDGAPVQVVQMHLKPCPKSKLKALMQKRRGAPPRAIRGAMIETLRKRLNLYDLSVARKKVKQEVKVKVEQADDHEDNAVNAEEPSQAPGSLVARLLRQMPRGGGGVEAEASRDAMQEELNRVRAELTRVVDIAEAQQKLADAHAREAQVLRARIAEDAERLKAHEEAVEKQLHSVATAGVERVSLSEATVSEATAELVRLRHELLLAHEELKKEQNTSGVLLTASKRLEALLESANERVGELTLMRNEQTAANAGMAREVRRLEAMLEEAQARASRAERRAEECPRATAHVSVQLTPAVVFGQQLPRLIRLAPAPPPRGSVLGPEQR